MLQFEATDCRYIHVHFAALRRDTFRISFQLVGGTVPIPTHHSAVMSGFIDGDGGISTRLHGQSMAGMDSTGLIGTSRGMMMARAVCALVHVPVLTYHMGQYADGNSFSIDVLDLMGTMSVAAKKAGFIVAMAPAQV